MRIGVNAGFMKYVEDITDSIKTVEARAQARGEFDRSAMCSALQSEAGQTSALKAMKEMDATTPRQSFNPQFMRCRLS